MTYIKPLPSFPNKCQDGTEKSGALCYPVCRKDYHGIGPVCYKNAKAPRTLKSSYGRGFGSLMSCTDGKDLELCYKSCGGDEECHNECNEQDRLYGNIKKSGGMCYKGCGDDYKSVGPICWSTCGGEYPVKCGAGCAKSNQLCRLTAFDQLQTSTQLMANLISLVALAKGAPLAGVVFAAPVLETAALASLKSALDLQMKDFSDLPDSIAMGIVNELVEKASTGDPIDWPKMDPTGGIYIFNSSGWYD